MSSAQTLVEIARKIRADVLQMVYGANAGHVAGPLSSADLMTLLFFGEILKVDPSNPGWAERDRLVLSCGHYCPVLYSVLARVGYFPQSELTTFMKINSRLPGHPERGSVPGIEVSSGPLGQGVSVATGMALALKMKYGQRAQALTPRVYCIVSDGEIQEGQVWEAFNFAVRRQLDNLIFILDRNRVQIENYISQLATYGSVVGRFEAFGLNVFEADGHDFERMKKIFMKVKQAQGGPTMVVLNTVAGKGVSFMENKPEWHDKVPSEDQLKVGLQELREGND